MPDGCLLVFMHLRVCVIACGCACLVVCVDVWVCLYG